MLEQPALDLSASEEGQVIRDAVEEMGAAFALELDVARMTGSAQWFCSRAVLLTRAAPAAKSCEQEKSRRKRTRSKERQGGAEGGWRAHWPVYATALSLGEDFEELLDLFQRLHARHEEGDSVVLWMSMVRTKAKVIPQVLAHHASGLVALFLVKQDRLMQVPLGPQALERMARATFVHDEQEKEDWVRGFSAVADAVHENARSSVSDLLQGAGLPRPLTDEQWEELVRSCVVRREVLRAVQDVARDCASRAVGEAASLLQVLTRALTVSRDKLTEQEHTLRKGQERALNKLRSSLQTQQKLHEGLRKRTQYLEKENRRLLDELRSSKHAARPAIAGASEQPHAPAVWQQLAPYFED